MAAFGAKAAERARRVIEAASTVVAIGIQSEEGRAPKQSRDELAAGNADNLATIAAIHEFGTIDQGGRIPQRSFLRATADAERRVWLRGFRAALVAYIDGNPARYQQVLGVLGAKARGDVQRRIRERIPPPLAARTVAERRKGGRLNPDGTVPDDVPLIDTGQLVNSIRSQADTPMGRILLG